MLQGQKEEQRENSVSGSSRRRKRKSNLKVEQGSSSGRSTSSSRGALRGNANGTVDTLVTKSPEKSVEGTKSPETGDKNSDANNSNSLFDISLARFRNSSSLWLEVVTRSNHSRTGSRSDRRSQSRRRSSRGNNSIRSTGSRNGSRSSHGSILSMNSMASEMDSGTDSDLEYEILSDDETDNNYHEDEEVLTETDSDSEDENSQNDDEWKQKPDKRGTPHVSGSQTTESAKSVLKSSPSRSIDEPLTKPSSPASALPTKELRFQSLPEQQAKNTTQGESTPLSKKMPNVSQAGGILRNGYGKPKNKQSKYVMKEGKLSFGKIGRNSEASKQVLWATELKEEYSHHSKDKVQKETLQDYAIPLKQLPNNSMKRHSADAFFSLLKSAESATVNSGTNKRGSFSSESVYSLNSSNRQDSFPDLNDLEFMSQRRSSFNTSFASQVSQIIDSDHDRTRIEITSTPLSNHEEVITIPLSGDKPTKANWGEVNKRLQNRQRLDDVAMENGTGPRYSFESEVEVSEDLYFAPREGRESASSIDLPMKSIKRKSDGDESKTMALNSSLDSHVMEYSFSQHGNSAMGASHEEKSNPSPSDRILRNTVRWVVAFVVVLTTVLLLYFFLRPDAVEEDQAIEVDSLFVMEP